MKARTLKIKVGKSANLLWESSCGNFIKEQPERFEILEGNKNTNGKYIYFCERYLESILVRELYKGDAIFFDVENNEFVVVTNHKFNIKTQK